jgi:Lamin Tail Domain
MKYILTYLLLATFFISCEEEKNKKENDTPVWEYPSNMPEGNLDFGLRVSEVVPNPDGIDVGNESLVITNYDTDSYDLNSWVITDIQDNSSNNENNFRLDVGIYKSTLQSNESHTIIINSTVAVLRNTGDTLYLFSPDEQLVQTFSWGEVESGEIINFEE